MKSKLSKGTTLIELIVSIAILGIISVPLLGMLAASMQNNAYSRSKISNGAIAQAAMEYYKSIGKDELETCFSGETSTNLYVSIGYDINKTDTSIMLNTLTSALASAATYSPEPADNYEAIRSKAPDNNFYIKASLSKVDGMVKIEINVWDSVKKDSGRFNLCSLRGI